MKLIETLGLMGLFVAGLLVIALFGGLAMSASSYFGYFIIGFLMSVWLKSFMKLAKQVHG